MCFTRSVNISRDMYGMGLFCCTNFDAHYYYARCCLTLQDVVPFVMHFLSITLGLLDNHGFGNAIVVVESRLRSRMLSLRSSLIKLQRVPSLFALIDVK